MKGMVALGFLTGLVKLVSILPHKTYLRASLKILSSPQSGLASSSCLALLLCSRIRTVTSDITKGFWLTLRFPENLQSKSHTHVTYHDLDISGILYYRKNTAKVQCSPQLNGYHQVAL